MCSSQVRKPSLVTPQMLEEFQAQRGITKLPTYTPQTGEKRLKEAQKDYAKKHPIPEKKATFAADAPKRFEAPSKPEESLTEKAARIKRLRERGF